MRWEERLLDLFDDLEQQAEGLALVERDALVAEQSRSEYAAVALADRLHASVGTRLLLDVGGPGALDGRLVRAGDGWCLLELDGVEWVVVTAAVRAVRGLVDAGRSPEVRPLTARLGLGSALRGLAGDRAEVLLHRVDGSTARGRLGRVGRDFVEVLVGDEGGDGAAGRGHLEVLPFATLAALRAR
jgi:hypothetical protein